MKKLYEKNELTFAIVWMVIYCVLQSMANPLNEIIGIEYSASAVFCILQTIVLLGFIRKNGLQKRYGLCRSQVPAWRFLYYVPLLVLASGNLWNGFAVNYSPTETVCRIVCMLCVGFLEEVIFRGLLFVSIAKDNVKSAIIISSVTFGIEHIRNFRHKAYYQPFQRQRHGLGKQSVPDRFCGCGRLYACNYFLSRRQLASLYHRSLCY